MSKASTNINVSNKVALKDKGGYPVAFQATNHYNATTLFSDTVDLPTPGYLILNGSGNVNMMLIDSDVALVYTFEAAGIYPYLVKRILSTSTTVSSAYIGL